jgi:hypothetical protein
MNRVIFGILAVSSIFTAVFVTQTQAADFYASPSATTGTGTITNPWSLTTALTHPAAVRPGDTIYLRGGTYAVNNTPTQFWSRLKGTFAAPITLRSYPGEHARIDGGIRTELNDSSYTIFRDFEIYNSSTERSGTAGSNRPPGLYLTTIGHKAINLIIHDTGHPGIGYYAGAAGEIYGCLIWGTGTYDDDRNGTPRGSAIYAQNTSSSSNPGYVNFRDTISFRNFTTGMKAYGEDGRVDNFNFEGNVSFDNGDRQIFAASGQQARNIILRNNYTYRDPADNKPPMRLGYFEIDQINAIVEGNVFVGGTHSDGAFYTKKFQQLTFQNNVVVGPGILATFIPPDTRSTYIWNSNSYYNGNSSPFRNISTTISFSDWKAATGFDQLSTLSTTSPIGVSLYIRPNIYDAHRANVIIYNWNQASNITIPHQQLLETGIQAGDSYQLRNAEDYFHDITTGIYSGNGITVSMLNRTAVTIPGIRFTAFPTFPKFGVFVLSYTPSSNTLTFTPTDDASIRPDWSSNPSVTTLQLDTDFSEESLLKFTISGIGSRYVGSAKLRVYNVNASDLGGSVYVASHNNWQENNVLWNTAPQISGNVLSSLNAVNLNTWYEFDLKSTITADGTYSFRLVPTSADSADYSSKEGNFPPQLVLTLYDSPPQTLDLDQDQDIDFIDLLHLIRNYNNTGIGDVDGSGRVTIIDYNTILKLL